MVSAEELIAEATKAAEGLRQWHKLTPVGKNEPHTGTLVRVAWDAGVLVDRLAAALTAQRAEIADLTEYRDATAGLSKVAYDSQVALQALRAKVREAVDPFRRVYGLNKQLSAAWSDDKPLSEIIPGLWPRWGDLRRIAALYREVGGEE